VRGGPAINQLADEWVFAVPLPALQKLQIPGGVWSFVVV